MEPHRLGEGGDPGRSDSKPRFVDAALWFARSGSSPPGLADPRPRRHGRSASSKGGRRWCL